MQSKDRPKVAQTDVDAARRRLAEAAEALRKRITETESLLRRLEVRS